MVVQADELKIFKLKGPVLIVVCAAVGPCVGDAVARGNDRVGSGVQETEVVVTISCARLLFGRTYQSVTT
jgi:hypothetical protein